MTTTRSEQLASGTGEAGAGPIIYTVPSGVVVILKSFALSTFGGNGGDTVLYLRPAGNPPGSIALAHENPISPTNVFTWQGWIVMVEGDRLVTFNDLFPYIYVVSGTVLPLD
jgi:hypothetical protein